MRRTHPLRTILVAAATLAAVLAMPAVGVATPAAPGSSAAPSATAQGATTSAVSINALAQIVVGDEFGCGLADDAKVYCWGRGSAGVLGTGSTANTYLPGPVTTSGTALDGKSIKQITAGNQHVCALASDGTVACWGVNDRGQLGDGTSDDRLTAVALATTGTPLDGKFIDMVTAGGTHTCAKATDDTMACWGQAGGGRLGNGATSGNQLTPAAVTTTGTPLDGKAIAEIEAGRFTTCAVATDGVVACWGTRFKGGLGDGSDSGQSAVPTSPTTTGTPLDGKAVERVTVGRYTVCAVTTDDIVACWGWGNEGQIGDGDLDDELVPTSPTVAGTPLDGATIDGIAAGDDHICVDIAGAGPACWGEDLLDQIGTADDANALVPTAVTTAGTPLDGATIDAIAAGESSSCALHSSGHAACWGDGFRGGLGQGFDQDSKIPVAVALDADLPDTPVITSAVAGPGSIQLAWTAPNDNGAPITDYVIRAYVDGTESFSRTYSASATDVPFSGLDPDLTYQLSVQAINAVGAGPESARSAAITPLEVPPEGVAYYPIDPCRIVDTRQAGGRFANREIRDYTVAGDGPAFAAQGGKPGGCGVPAEAIAVEASITAVGPLDSGFFRAWPSSESMPNATFMNFDRGMDITNTGAITIDPDEEDQLRARNFGGASHYVVDLQGYYVDPDELGAPAPEAATAAAEVESSYTAITPCRIVDTRQAGGRLGDREIRDVSVTGSGARFAAQGGKAGGCAIPNGAVAVEASITAVDPLDSGFFRAWPSGQSMPNATFMNFDRDMDITNTGALTIAAGHTTGSAATNAEGDHLRIRNFGGASHYVIDIQGYFSPDRPVMMEAASASGPARYVPIVPCRIVDTRQAGGPLTDREIRIVTVSGDGPAFAAQGGKAGGCAIPNGTVAVEASITAVSPADSGFFRAWPPGRSLPNATFMNFDQGMDITNTGSVTISTPDFLDPTPSTEGDHLRIRNYGGTSHYVIDIQGFHFVDPFEER